MPPAPIELPKPIAALAIVALTLSLALSLGALGGVPHVPDEVVYAIQARIFADGHRVAPLAEPDGLLRYSFLLTSPGLAGAFPPGWPALLAVFELLGLQVLANPLLAALAVPLGWEVARRLTDNERAAGFAALILALSPGFLILGASRMAHTSALVATLVIARQALRGETGWLSGAALGFLLLSRPFDAAFAGIPALLLGGLPDRRVLLRVALPASLGLGLLLADNALLTGDPFQHPASTWFAAAYPDRPGCNRLGFGPEVGCYPTFGSLGHSPEKALTILWESAQRFDRLLLGFPGGGLLALVGALSLLRRRPALVLLLVGVPVIHALYWTPGLAYGARFWHTLYLFIPAGLGLLLARLPARAPLMVAGVLPLAMLPKVWGELSDRYFCVDGDLATGLAARGIEDGVLFVWTRGQTVQRYPTLGVDGLLCTEDLARGSAWALLDPGGSLAVRGMPSSPEGVAGWLAEHAPGERAWVVLQDVSLGGWSIAEITPQTGQPGQPEPL